MRIVITADTHFGHSDSLGKVNPETGLHVRLEDFLRMFDMILDFVTSPQNGIDLLIIAGDLYKTRHPTNTQQEEFAKRLRRLQENEVETLILMGNHDIVVSEGASHTAGVLKALVDSKWIHIFDKPAVFTKDDVDIVLMPYIYRQKLGFRTNVETLEYYKEKVEELLQQCTNQQRIFVGHQAVDGAKLVTGYIDPEKVAEIVVPQSYIKDFDFAAFGHVHEYQVMGQDPVSLYTGPIDRIDFGQADKPIGFVVYDARLKKHKFIELPAVDLYRVKVDLTNVEGDLTEYLMSMIDMNRVPSSILKIEYTIKESDIHRLNIAALQEVRDKAKFDAGVSRRLIREQVSRNEEVNETVSAEEALEKYLESRPDLKDIKDEILRRGVEIIRICDANR